LKHSIEQFKHLSTHYLVISVHDEKNISTFAVVFCCHSQIDHCSLLLLVPNDCVPLLRQLRLRCHQLLDLPTRIVGAGVVDEDDVEVAVVLHEHRAHVLEVALVLDVVVAGDDYAEGQLLVFADVILLLEVVSLFVGQGGLSGGVFVFEFKPANSSSTHIYCYACNWTINNRSSGFF
jgi:hypothetical protein